ncbi:MAG: S-methyl-5'-thioinosine phosphorylase [Gammaproteobacteria bacterium]|nr:S-methyl-5'-thioinosine phosphorylase [Gammaproteobacteria bacterium]NNJ83680.1 S-methyl-5'-thioinosine phosphorylase [Gammaproteobacteria bacterium]
MTILGIIGGTGLRQLEGLTVTQRAPVETPYGPTSGSLIYGSFHDRQVIFLARHGDPHNIDPHRINYRANIWALGQAGVRKILATSAVGGIHPDLTDGRLAIPDQIIDYTWGRGHSFFEDDPNETVHIDFTEPYCPALRALLLRAARAGKIAVRDGGTYGAMQGPRLETAAEINRLERDGCDMVGMTGMPEAALARELDICYASCALVVNPAAGRGDGPIRMEDILRVLETGMGAFRNLVRHVLLLME